MHYRRIAHAALLWRILFFFATLLLLWGPWAVCIYGLGWLWGQSQLASVLALVVLYSCFIGLAWFWGRWIHHWQEPFKVYGLVLGWRFVSDVAVAWLCGFGLICVLFGTEVLLGWASFHPRTLTLIALEGLMVSLGIGFAEELLFRGWLLAELRTGLSQSQSIVWNSCIFAVAHFIRPLSEVLKTSPQFLGLLLLGIILASGRYVSCPRRRQFTSLGVPMGLHGGLVWGYYMVDVGDLIMPSSRVPEWVIGIHGNPLSGVLGVAMLGCLTVLFFLKLRSK